LIWWLKNKIKKTKPQELNLQSEKSNLDHLARRNHRETKYENRSAYKATKPRLMTQVQTTLGEKRGPALGGKVMWQNRRRGEHALVETCNTLIFEKNRIL
jgi:hypothetical protein